MQVVEGEALEKMNVEDVDRRVSIRRLCTVRSRRRKPPLRHTTVISKPTIDDSDGPEKDREVKLLYAELANARKVGKDAHEALQEADDQDEGLRRYGPP